MAPTPSCPVAVEAFETGLSCSLSVDAHPTGAGPLTRKLQLPLPEAPVSSFQCDSSFPAGMNCNGVNASSSLPGLEKMMLANFHRLHSQQNEILRRLRQLDQHDDQQNLVLKGDATGMLRQASPSSSNASKHCVPEDGATPGLSEKQKFAALFASNTSAISKLSTVESAISSEVQDKKEPKPYLSRGHTGDSISSHNSSDSGSVVYFSDDQSGLPARRRRRSISTSGSKDDMARLAAIVARHTKRFQMSPWAKAVWVFFENRNSGKCAYLYGAYLAPALICVSVFLAFFQTSEDWVLSETVRSTMQMSIEILFAAELSLRFKACPDRCAFLMSMFNWIDFLSAAPIPLRMHGLLLGTGNSSFRILGLVPIVRLLKVLRRFHKFQLLMEAFALTAEALPVLLFSLGVIAVLFSGLIYYVEPRSLIPSLPKALWFVVGTMTTVGYGDIVPETSVGSCIAVALMVVSALYMAMPIGIVGNAFSKAWDDRDRLLLISSLRETFGISGVSLPLFRDMVKLFAGRDLSDPNSEQDPSMTLEQFRSMILALQINVTDGRIVDLFNSVDDDGSGSIDMSEFVELLFPKGPFQKKTNAITATASTITVTASNTASMLKRSLSTVSLADTDNKDDVGSQDGASSSHSADVAKPQEDEDRPSGQVSPRSAGEDAASRNHF